MTREERIANGPSTQAAYEDIVDQAAEIRMQKVLAYGEDRYNDPDLSHSLLVLYGDVYRKYIRVKEAILSAKRNEVEPLIETFLDLANYALMGAQLLEKERSKQLPKELVQDRVGTRIDQIAITTKDPELAKGLLGELLDANMTDWVHDTVNAEGTVGFAPGANEASLSFKYDLVKGGVEFEVLEYISGPNWLASKKKYAGVSHLGIHVSPEEMERMCTILDIRGFKKAQEVTTTSHTNLAIKDKRRYKYVIWDTEEVLGFDVKLIQRLEVI